MLNVELHLVENLHFLRCTLLVKYLLTPLKQIGIGGHIELLDLLLRYGLREWCLLLLIVRINVTSLGSFPRFATRAPQPTTTLTLTPSITIPTEETPRGLRQVALRWLQR